MSGRRPTRSTCPRSRLPTTGDGRVVEVGLEVAHPGGVAVARDDHGVARPAAAERSRAGAAAAPGSRPSCRSRTPASGPAMRSFDATIICLASTFHARRRGARPSNEPRLLLGAEHRRGRVVGAASRSTGWSERYWRVSSTWNVARSPHPNRRYSCMSGPRGRALRRSGMCSQYAWNAAIAAGEERLGRLRSRDPAGSRRPSCCRSRGRRSATIHGNGGVRGLQVGVGLVAGVAGRGSRRASYGSPAPSCWRSAAGLRRGPRRCSRRGTRRSRGPRRPVRGRRCSSRPRSAGTTRTRTAARRRPRGAGRRAGAADRADLAAGPEPVPVRRRPGCSPPTSTCTRWPSPGRATLGAAARRPGGSGRRRRPPTARRTARSGMPPPGTSGSGASRVHSTTPSGSGSPDATPSVKGAGAPPWPGGAGCGGGPRPGGARPAVVDGEAGGGTPGEAEEGASVHGAECAGPT